MPHDRKSVISGALVAYLATTAIQTLAQSISYPKSLDYSVAVNCGLALLMLASAFFILKEKRVGFIAATLCMLASTIWSFVVLAKYPVIGNMVFWTNIGVLIILLALALPYAYKKNGA